MPDSYDESLLLDNQLCFALYAASRKVIHQYNPMLNEMEVTYTQYIALLVLWEKRSLTIKELGQFLMLDTGTLTPMLKKMEAKGLLTRTRSKADERVVYIEITPAGDALKKVAAHYLSSLYCSTHIHPGTLNELRVSLKQLILSLDACEDIAE